MSHRVFGIRHHGPGSAKRLVQALDAYQPDIVLIEGPPEGDSLIEWAAHPQIKPPVALLVYAEDSPGNASFYPFAEFSPEWQALRYAARQAVPARFIDLPVAIRLASRLAEDEEDNPATPLDDEVCAEGDDDDTEAETTPAGDPLDALAALSGDVDGEAWWDRLVERSHHGEDLFEAVGEAMAALREQHGWLRPDEAQREAAMRQGIRQADKEGFSRIAVVCGAWHAPALSELPPARQDQALLKNLKKLKTTATWVPWTNQRLGFASGYGAGVESPGWYRFLFRHNADGADFSARWLTHVARLLRKQGLGASSAEVIDAVRLAEQLAQLGGRSRPGLTEFQQAARAVFCLGDDLPLRLVQEQLIVGQAMGKVPDDMPAAPIARDLAERHRKLRLKPEAAQRDLELDLRQHNDLARSELLHQLRLIEVPWGQSPHSSGRGTFREHWRLQWQPEFPIALVEAGRWGSTVRDAARARLLERAEAATLVELTELLDQALLAGLDDCVAPLLQRVDAVAAQHADTEHLLRALPRLVKISRYGTVRRFDQQALGHIVADLTTRACISLPLAAQGLNDDGARALLVGIDAVDHALATLDDAALLDLWTDALGRFDRINDLHGLLGGRALRLRLDHGRLDGETAGRALGFALSDPQPERGADWIEGFVRGSGLVLVHDDRLWGLIDDWLQQLSPEGFVAVLPLLRRAFAQFEAGERRQLGERARAPRQRRQVAMTPSEQIDVERARAALPLLARMLGLKELSQ
ncbi:DUF5682 family protein [Chitinimonas lacunae]|uniref:DUF5682 family protein n=1 Tax=Chitinimonas lacunae TaxID=1963018 RepID=A0ABV8MTJ8_9NEIS